MRARHPRAELDRGRDRCGERARSSALLLALLVACSGPMAAAPHHDPAQAFAAAEERHAGFTPMPATTPVPPQLVAVRAFGGEVLAPTGSLIMDDHPEGPVVEAYLIHNVREVLYSRVTEQLARRGLRVLRIYDDATPVPPEVAAVLDVQLRAFELHRWKKSSLFGSGRPGIVDVARVQYDFRWQRARGEASQASGGHELLTEPGADPLAATAQLMAEAFIAALGRG